ncbi:MAG: NAD(P)/FAD-dependent oxidoreductase [Allorhizobium sp.]
MAVQKHIVVVGAGILGASIAWHLATAGARVTVIGEAPGGVATPASFAWINASWGNPEPYFRLRLRAMKEWQRLAEQLPGLAPNWCGGLCFDLPDDALNAYANEHGVWGYGIHGLNRDEIEQREPNLAQIPDFALHVAAEGTVEPLVATKLLLADAQRRGATVKTGHPVNGLVQTAGKITGVRIAEAVVDADHVVLAAGAGTAALAATIGLSVPLQSPPGLLVHSKPYRPVLNGLVLAPEMHLRQTREGRIVAGGDFGGSDPGGNPTQMADALFNAARSRLRGAEDLEFERYTIGYRPTPVDGFPIIGAAEIVGLSLAVSHSGVTLAPAIGLFMAQEILEVRTEPLLEPYRFSRFG